MVIIFILSGRESVQVAENFWYNFLFFKTLHVIEYSILFTLYLRPINRTYTRKNGVNIYAVAFLLTLFYAITDEIHQTFVPTREGRARDVIIDAFGGLLSWITIVHYIPKAPKKLKTLAEMLLTPS